MNHMLRQPHPALNDNTVLRVAPGAVAKLIATRSGFPVLQSARLGEHFASAKDDAIGYFAPRDSVTLLRIRQHVEACFAAVDAEIAKLHDPDDIAEAVEVRQTLQDIPDCGLDHAIRIIDEAKAWEARS